MITQELLDKLTEENDTEDGRIKFKQFLHDLGLGLKYITIYHVMEDGTYFPLQLNLTEDGRVVVTRSVNEEFLLSLPEMIKAE